MCMYTYGIKYKFTKLKVTCNLHVYYMKLYAQFVSLKNNINSLLVAWSLLHTSDLKNNFLYKDFSILKHHHNFLVKFILLSNLGIKLVTT